MTPPTIQTKRYKTHTKDLIKERQISSLLGIISNNLLLVTELVKEEHDLIPTKELETLSLNAKKLSRDLSSEPVQVLDEEVSARISSIKQQILSLIIDLSSALNNLDLPGRKNKKSVEKIILVKKLLRESQRGLVTIQD